MNLLPQDVLSVQKQLLMEPSHTCAGVAGKLISNSPEIVTMWKSLERNKIGDDDLWVRCFLHCAARASELPKYHYLPQKSRESLAQEIIELAEKFTTALVDNKLDVHLVHCTGINFNGFYWYEDFSEKNQSYIDDKEEAKIHMNELINSLAKRAAKIINEEPQHGKSGKNVRAIRFARMLAEHNSLFGRTSPLLAVVATATNAIFDTNYDESAVHRLLNR